MKTKEKITLEGYLSIRKDESILWEIPFDRNRKYFKFPFGLINKFKLRNGTRIKCLCRDKKIIRIEKICGRQPEKYSARSDFRKLLPVNPYKKFDFDSSVAIAPRILDLFIPIGKGTRGLIVSPPRTGKTVLLETIANEIQRLDPNLKLIILLIDERPEEVTSFIRNTKADVFHSSLDKDTKSHILLSEYLLDHIQIELECGNDIVILIDSLTRMGRAFNIRNDRFQNRIMSGGLAAGALELPRKLFGMARNIENGGSCTILATILKDTDSRMDEVIFHEFKGTGNCEIILDRDMAEKRLFPAIDIKESGTRKEELFRSKEEQKKIDCVRRDLFHNDKETILNKLSNLLKQYPSNKVLIENEISTKNPL